ncbi:MAG: PepSY-associated TM helix domain-containing protein [Novosphingobium sp.]
MDIPDHKATDKARSASILYRTVWRWHFYAGLLIIPMVLVLSVTGGIYLFKPQIDRWEERNFRNYPIEKSVSPSAQRDAVLAKFRGVSFVDYRLPQQPGDAVLIHIRLAGGKVMREVFVSPQGAVVGTLDPDRRFTQIVHDVHGQLLMGPRGSWLVEFAASWAIVLIVSGLYLWWPKGTGLAGVIWPRFRGGRRTFLRDIHAVSGFWVSGFALVLLVTGLPWTDVWGSVFKAARTEMGWVRGVQDWTIGGRSADDGAHAIHTENVENPRNRGEHTSHTSPTTSAVGLDAIVARAAAEKLAFPVIVTPPATSDAPWVVRSDSQNRPLRTTLKFDAMTGELTSRRTFADQHPIDRFVGYGIAWHEGQLFGWINQLIGTLTAAALVTLSIAGFLSWRRRKPKGQLGAPRKPAGDLNSLGIKILVALFFVALPMFALTVAATWLVDRFVLRRLPKFGRWLGYAGPRPLESLP